MSNEIISLNDFVTVTLTEYGAKVLNESHMELARQFPKASKDILAHIYQDGEIVEKQLWILLSSFDGHVGWGQEMVFKDFQVGSHKAEREKEQEKTHETST